MCCIAAIAGLANQETARTGNILGVAGVAFGLSATTADMSLAGATVPVFEQTALLAGVGSGVGAVLASGVGPTELPQTVAAFHSLVGLAAMAGAAGEYFGNAGSLDIGTLSSIYLATFIGGITATGSMVAFGKLAGMLKVSHFIPIINAPTYRLSQLYAFESQKHFPFPEETKSTLRCLLYLRLAWECSLTQVLWTWLRI